MREELSSANRVIKTLLNHVGGSRALAQLAEGQSAEAIVASLPGIDSTGESPRIITREHSPPTQPAVDPRSALAVEFADQTMSSLPRAADQPGATGLPASWHWLESNYQLESTQTTADNPTAARTPNTPLTSQQHGPKEFLSAQKWSQGTVPAPGSWSTITDDIKLVHHLLALFFCWEYPTFVTLSREHFIDDFRSGSGRYCSPILVNAILATGCRFSNQQVGRGRPDDPSSSGDLFFQEAERLLECETDQHSLPTIQALSIMSLREMSCGRQPSAKYLAGQAVRLAFEMGLHAPQEAGHTPDDLIVLSATFWGVYALDKYASTRFDLRPDDTR